MALSSCNNGSVSESSRTIWRLNALDKVKFFAWRACRNFLPSNKNLCCWKVIDNPRCEACNDEAESSGHVSWGCPTACEVWTLSGIDFDTHGFHFVEFEDFIWHLKFEDFVWHSKFSLNYFPLGE